MRNFEFCIGIKSAVIAGFLAVALHSSDSFGQARRVALSPKQNAPQPTQSPGAPSSVAVQSNDQFLELLDRAIEITSKRHLTANSHSPWQIFHYVLAMRQDCVLRLGNEKVNAIQWLSTSEPQFDKEPWLLLTPHGAKFHPYTKKWYFEGHPAQFLALLSHSDLPLDFPFHVQGKVVTLSDLLNNTMKEVNTNEEVTWVLWALQHYLKTDATWLNQANEPWSIERLVQIESAAPIVGTPCGGNHRLFALTRTRDKYLKSGGKLRGVWLQADQKINQHIEIARSLQNPDGSFSDSWYQGPKNTNDVNERFNKTGHTMEFLAVGLPDRRLNEPWVRNAVWTLSRELIINRDTQIDCGPLFHSLDALIIYRDRIRPKTPVNESTVATPTEKPQPIENPSGINLNSKPVPMQAMQPPRLLPEKSASEQNSPELNAPEPLTQPVPESDRLKRMPPPLTEPQASRQELEFSKPRIVFPAKEIPKLDAALFPNVGQVANSSTADKQKVETGRPTRRDRIRSLAPELLPEQSAPPEKSQPKAPVTSAPTDSTDNRTETPAAAAEVRNVEPDHESNSNVPTVDMDEPASAISPANAQRHPLDES